MKYKKYLFVLLLTMIIGVNNISAASIKTCQNDDDCYYASSEGDTYMCYNPKKNKITISLTKEKNGKTDPLINMKKDVVDKETGITATKIGNTCPKYLVYRYKDGFLFFNSEGIWGFNDLSNAKQFTSSSNGINNINAYLAVQTTKESYDTKLTKTKTEIVDVTQKMDCEKLFDDELMEIIDEILQYPRIIVPILVILLGSLDFAKAVIAQKEDEMKKAQSTFIKRLIIGVAFFFIPSIVDVIMWLANIVWNGMYPTCGI